MTNYLEAAKEGLDSGPRSYEWVSAHALVAIAEALTPRDVTGEVMLDVAQEATQEVKPGKVVGELHPGLKDWAWLDNSGDIWVWRVGSEGWHFLRSDGGWSRSWGTHVRVGDLRNEYRPFTALPDKASRALRRLG